MANEKDHTYTSLPVLSKVKIGSNYYYLKDAEARSVIDSILNDYLTSTDKAALQALIDAKVSQTEYDTKVSELIAADSALGKRITDELKTEAETRKNADDALGARIDTIEAAAIGVKSGENVISLNSSTHELSTTLGLTLENRDDGKEYLVLTGINGAKVADIDATRFLKDGMINNVELKTEGEKKYLVITFNTDAGQTKPIKLDVSELIDVYTAGDGLTLTDRKFAVNKDSTSEEFLVVSSSGIKITGVQKAINDAKDAAKVYTDQEVGKEKTRATEAENALGTRLTTAEDKITKLEGKPAAGISADQISKWDNEVGAKADIATEKSRAEAAEKAINDKIGSSADSKTASTVYGAIAAEADARSTADTQIRTDFAAADETTLSSAKSYADGIVKTERERAEDAEGDLDTKITGVSGKVTAIEGKEAGWDAKLNNVKLNGNFVEVKSDVEGKGNYVDLGKIATDTRVSALEGRVTTAESDIDALEGEMATVQGTGEGSISKAKQDAITESEAWAKKYADDEDAKLKTVQDGAHTHTVTGSVTFVPNLTPTVKHLSASASGTELNVTNSVQFMKSVAPQTSKLVRAPFVNNVEKVAQNFNNLVATVGDTTEGEECLVLSTVAMSFNSVGNIGTDNAATGALDSNGTGDTVAYGLAEPTMEAAVTAVSVKTNPTITLSNTGSSGVEFLSNVVGASTSTNLVGGIAVEAGAHTHVINKTGK